MIEKNLDAEVAEQDKVYVFHHIEFPEGIARSHYTAVNRREKSPIYSHARDIDGLVADLSRHVSKDSTWYLVNEVPPNLDMKPGEYHEVTPADFRTSVPARDIAQIGMPLGQRPLEPKQFDELLIKMRQIKYDIKYPSEQK